MKLAFKRSRYWPLIAMAALIAAFMASPALAATWNWVGPTTNNNWNNPNNWFDGAINGIPAAGDIAILNSGAGSGNKTATYNLTPNPGVLAEIDVQNSAADTGTFTINQSSKALSALNESIGIYGKAVYNQSGGTNTISQTLALGVVSGSNGTYNKTGGTFSTGAMVLGNGGIGTFKQSSGTVTIGAVNPDTGQPFSLILGGEVLTSGTGTGTYNKNAGNLTVGSGVVVGQTGTGIFTQSAGNTTINGGLVVGNQTGSSGSFTMSSGTLKVTGDEIIGDHGVGTFKQSSGAHTIGGGLFVGNNPGSTGSSFTMTSGSLGIGGGLFVASEGSTATMTQTSGSVTAGGDFVLGRLPGTDGTYNMTSGSLKINGPNGAYIGQSGTGTFNQTSGSNTIAKQLFIAPADGSVGTYNLNSGSVTAKNSPPNDSTADIINYGSTFPSASGSGTFNVTGTATVTGDFLNFGVVKTTNADVTWNGIFTNNNSYTSDPGSKQTFIQDLVINQTGYLVATAPLKPNGTANDKFILKEDFVITPNNTQEANWDTHLALLNFNKGTDKIHDLSVAGTNTGPPGVNGGSSNVISHNYAWGSLDITNQTINLVDANTSATEGALYVNYLLTGVDITSQPGKAANINGPLAGFDLDIFYNPDVNPTLLGLTYAYNSGLGELRPYHTPLPPSVLLMGSGLLGLGLLGWRRKKLKG